jgi:hypothetical protein
VPCSTSNCCIYRQLKESYTVCDSVIRRTAKNCRHLAASAGNEIDFSWWRSVRSRKRFAMTPASPFSRWPHRSSVNWRPASIVPTFTHRIHRRVFSLYRPSRPIATTSGHVMLRGFPTANVKTNVGLLLIVANLFRGKSALWMPTHLKNALNSTYCNYHFSSGTQERMIWALRGFVSLLEVHGEYFIVRVHPTSNSVWVGKTVEFTSRFQITCGEFI